MTPQHKDYMTYWVSNKKLFIIKVKHNDLFLMSMNECLTTPQHEKQIGYWVSEKGKRMKWL